MEKIDKIISLAKQRGFVFPSAEIYGGIRSGYDYGPLGFELAKNIKKAWWQAMVQERNDIYGLDSNILTPRVVWEASGHMESFSDPLVECKKCHKRFRQDKIDGDKCPECKGELGEPKEFNLLMKTHLGVVEGEQSEAYLRGETCQGIYLNYLNVRDSMRAKVPFGIAQIGKAFRNEITPGNFIFRTREFEQMEMQYFVHESEADKYFNQWKEWALDFYKKYINDESKLRLRQHESDELAHYAKEAWDVEYETSFMGWDEFGGIHNRGNWDLSRHAEYSKQKIDYLNPQTGERFTPWVQEVSMGVGRAMLLFLEDAYTEVETRSGDDDSKHQVETVMKFHPALAPIKVAILPLAKKEPIQKLALEVQNKLNKKYMTQYDERGSVGKRYRRQDEIGTPYCLTVDFDSLEDNQVTIRDRDTMEQVRISIDEVEEYFAGRFEF